MCDFVEFKCNRIIIYNHKIKFARNFKTLSPSKQLVRRSNFATVKYFYISTLLLLHHSYFSEAFSLWLVSQVVIAFDIWFNGALPCNGGVPFCASVHCIAHQFDHSGGKLRKDLTIFKWLKNLLEIFLNPKWSLSWASRKNRKNSRSWLLKKNVLDSWIHKAGKDTIIFILIPKGPVGRWCD